MDLFGLFSLISRGISGTRQVRRMMEENGHMYMTPKYGGMIIMGLYAPHLPSGLLATAWMEHGRCNLYEGHVFTVTEKGIERLGGKWSTKHKETVFAGSEVDSATLSFTVSDGYSDLGLFSLQWAKSPNTVREYYILSCGEGIFTSADLGRPGSVYAEWSTVRVKDQELFECASTYISRAKDLNS